MTYATLRDHAANYAGYSSGSIPAGELAMLVSFIALHLRSAWRAAPWPEVRTVAAFTPASRLIAKGSTIDQVLRVTSANPRQTTRFRKLTFWDNSTTVGLIEDLTVPVYVDYLAPVPDLAAMEAGAREAYVIPDRIAVPVTYMAAGSLLRATGRADQGNEFLRLGESALAEEATLFYHNPDD